MAEQPRVKAVFNWSGGKDSAHALFRVMQSNRYEIVALLTTVNSETDCSTMHHIPLALLEAQARSIGIPLYPVQMTPKGNMEDYSAVMERAVKHFAAMGVTAFIFGDIFLHDVRAYREKQLLPLGMEVVEPLWGKTSEQVMDDFLATDLKTIIVTTTASHLGREYIGRLIDADLVQNLPAGIDPNGENGEYHTFCYAGAIYQNPLDFQLGEPYCQHYDIRMEDGTTQTFSYWCVSLVMPGVE